MSELTAHYPDDRVLLGRISEARRVEFAAWMDRLEKVMDDWGGRNDGRPYGPGPLAESTGLECWFGYFDDGYEPEGAFSEDQTYWDDDGE